MNQISKRAKISKKAILEGDVKIFGASFVDDFSRIGFNSIIGYPRYSTIKKTMSNVLELGGGSTIGKKCYIRPGSHIYESVEISDNVQTGHRVFVREETKIGKNCMIGTNTVIDGYSIIGDYTKLETNVYLPTRNKIGKYNFFAPNVCVTNDKRPLPFCIFNESIKPKQDKNLKGLITEDYVCIGANATILPGIKIGYAAVVSAGAVVTKDVEPESVVIGVPARPLSITVYDLLKKQIETLLSHEIKTKEDVKKLPLPSSLKKKIMRIIQ
jgi:acetyltransferase-like isoleucine patch superfamily enzyme